MKGDLKSNDTHFTEKKYQIVPVKKSQGKAEPAADSQADSKKDTLVYLDQWTQKRIDETIDTPQKYISRYHWDSRNVDSYLELCPHCRKPTLYSYRKVVADAAMAYLEEKAFEKGRHSARRMYTGVTLGALLISAGVYYFLFHFLSGSRL